MEKHKESLTGKLRQFLAAAVVNLSMLAYGMIIGWQSPSAPQLQSLSPPVGSEPMTDDGVSWLSGLLCLGGVFMTILLSVIPDRFSRKRFGYLLTLPLILSWLLIIFATEHMYIYAARVLGGIAGASAFFLIPTYVSEISSDSIRGLLGSILAFSINFGILLAYILAGMMSLYTFAVVALVFPVLYLVAFVFIPESPVYLVRQNRIREAIRSLSWLNAGNNLVVEQTLSHLQAEVEKTNASEKSVNLSDLFRDRATIKGMIIVLGLFGGQQFSGIFAMISYTETIFMISGSTLSPNAAAIIVAVIQLLGSCLSSFLVERTGRRSLIFVSCAGMCVCHCVIGTFCYFQELKYDMSACSWLPVVALSVFMIMYSMGMGTAPIVVTSEIFNRDVSSLGTTIGLCFLWFSAFIIGKIFPNLVALLGMYGCFFLLATSCACTFLFCFVLLPETKGRLREDIVDELNGAWFKKKKNEKNKKHIIGTHSVHMDQV